MEAFEPKKTIFMHCCMNCEHSRKVAGGGGSSLGYICLLKDGTQRLFGTHECDVEAVDKNQLNCFDKMKEDK